VQRILLPAVELNSHTCVCQLTLKSVDVLLQKASHLENLVTSLTEQVDPYVTVRDLRDGTGVVSAMHEELQRITHELNSASEAQTVDREQAGFQPAFHPHALATPPPVIANSSLDLDTSKESRRKEKQKSKTEAVPRSPLREASTAIPPPRPVMAILPGSSKPSSKALILREPSPGGPAQIEKDKQAKQDPEVSPTGSRHTDSSESGQRDRSGRLSYRRPYVRDARSRGSYDSSLSQSIESGAEVLRDAPESLKSEEIIVRRRAHHKMPDKEIDYDGNDSSTRTVRI